MISLNDSFAWKIVLYVSCSVLLLINLFSNFQGFKEIQGELNACLACLDEGVGQIDNIKRPNSARYCCNNKEMSWILLRPIYILACHVFDMSCIYHVIVFHVMSFLSSSCPVLSCIFLPNLVLSCLLSCHALPYCHMS